MRRALALAGCLGIALAAALNVDFNSKDSIRKAASTVAFDLMTYYKGNLSGKIPGILPGPPPDGDYYWWEGGAMWGTLIDYWHYTGDETYNKEAQRSLVFQSGPPQYAYKPANWTASLGNDDQGFWALSAMLAAEVKFPDPPPDQPQWLALAQAVFNTQAAPDHHDTECGGGMRWQIPVTNKGYDYKNSIANGIFFNLGARLARYTGNKTYADWADQSWNWITGVGFLDAQYNVYDGASVRNNCTEIAMTQFSYNAAIWMQGAAFMYDYTNGSAVWRDRLAGLVNRTIAYFFQDGVLVERPCEFADQLTCTADMLSFKGYLLRWMATVVLLAPFTAPTIKPVLATSAAAAVKTCSGGDRLTQCGFRWTTHNFDGSTGAGQQMNALAALSVMLLDEMEAQAPVTNSTGGTSQGDAGAGGGGAESGGPVNGANEGWGWKKTITAADKLSAGVATLIVVGLVTATVAWMFRDWSESVRFERL